MDAVILHPHPDMGGDMFNPVVQALYERLPNPHRFNFKSSDIGLALNQTDDAIEAASPPVLLAGYSFGGGIAACTDHPAIAGWILVAPALPMVRPTIAADPRPKLVLAAEHDGFFSPELLHAATADWVNTEHETIPGTDHFFPGRAGAAATAAARWVQQLP